MDTGSRLLAAVTDGIVEDAWAVRTPGALRWWPHDLAQVVRVVPDGAADRATVHVETEVAADVDGRDPDVVELLRGANHASPLAVLAVGQDGVVRLVLTARVRPGDPEVGWLRRLLACQSSDAATWSGLAEVMGGRRPTSQHPSGPRDLPGAVLGAAREVEDHSWERGPAVDPDWVEAALGSADGSGPRWLGPRQDAVGAPWLVGSAPRWTGRDVLATSAWVELDATYGPALVVRTVVPWAVPAGRSGTLVARLNDAGRRGVPRGLRAGWHALADRPGVALRHVLPVGVLDAAVTSDPAVLGDAVRRLRAAHVLQARELAGAAEHHLPTRLVPDPWLTRPRA